MRVAITYWPQVDKKPYKYACACAKRFETMNIEAVLVGLHEDHAPLELQDQPFDLLLAITPDALTREIKGRAIWQYVNIAYAVLFMEPAMHALADAAIYRLFKLPQQRIFFLTEDPAQAKLFRAFLRIHNAQHVVHCLGDDKILADFEALTDAPWFTGLYDFSHTYQIPY